MQTMVGHQIEILSLYRNYSESYESVFAEMTVNHQHLRAFHAVAIEGSFVSAARRLNISQPTLSQQIKSLEQRYGVSLFERKRRPLALTPLGRELLDLTRGLFATSDEIDLLLEARDPNQVHSIRLASDSPIYAARMTQALSNSHPGLEIEVQIDNSRDATARLLDARADVAIVSDPRIDPRLTYQPLFVDDLKVLISIEHPLAGNATFPLQQLASECLIVREPSSKTRAAGDSLLQSLDLNPTRTIEIHSREAIREAVALGVGVSMFFSSECPPDTRLVALKPEHQPDSSLLTGYIVCRKEHRRSPMMRSVLATAAALASLNRSSVRRTGSC